MAISAPAPDLTLPGITAKFLADGAATAGRYLLADVEAVRGAAVPVHVHAREDEWLLVLDGEVLVTLDGAGRTVGPAEPAVLPREVPHGFEVVSRTARVLVMWDPAGIGDTPRPLPGPPLPRDLAALLAGAGVTLI